VRLSAKGGKKKGKGAINRKTNDLKPCLTLKTYFNLFMCFQDILLIGTTMSIKYLASDDPLAETKLM
jgi:hypothetical protein